MTSFALVTEGPTDQTALESILCGFYDDNDLDVAWLQPLRDATDSSRQNGFGGWELVLEYCTQYEYLVEALAFSNYLIIQIDTDMSEHVNFGVPLTQDGTDKPVDQLVSEVRAIIMEKLGNKFLAEYGTRVFYAVTVHSLECWLLPLFISDKRGASRLKSCEEHFERAVLRKNLDYKKEVECYYALSKGYTKKKNLQLGRIRNLSFDMFLSSLPQVEQKLTAE